MINVRRTARFLCPPLMAMLSLAGFSSWVVVASAEEFTPPKAGRVVAITFDDLPYVAEGSRPSVDAATVAQRHIVSALRRARVSATGFVNKLAHVLSRWHASSMRFGHLTPRLLVSLVLMTLLAAAAPPPAVLEPYIDGSAFHPGDYGWMRGRFSGASPGEKAGFKSIEDWLTQCMADEQARIRRELVSVGVVNSKLPPAPYQDATCRDVNLARANYNSWPSFAAFQADVQTAEPIVGTFLWATNLASDIGGLTEPNLAQQLLARPLGEQMLRFGSQWGKGRSASSAPKLSPGVRAIVTSRIGMAIGRSDHINTEYLKGVVAKQGWPKLSAVGERAANAAWLLAQHADSDPLFQLSALRLMEPLVAAGEVSKKSYAYLYDRVMLKTAGTQRYATQMTCQAGQRVPLPLEDPKTVDRLRAEAGLSTLAEYQQQMTKPYGNCPP